MDFFSILFVFVILFLLVSFLSFSFVVVCDLFVRYWDMGLC